MRALLERSKTARVAVAFLAMAGVVSVVHAADAGGDPGIRRETFLPDAILAAFGLSAPAPRPSEDAEREPILLKPTVAEHHRARPRRIWAAGHARPLRIALERRRTPENKPKVLVRVAPRPAPKPPSPVVFRLVPPPTKTALVSIFADKTLRSGDAVMLDDGLHVFRDDGFWPHRPRDFVRLQFVAGLDWHLRRTLEPFDKNPPTRWTSIMVPPA